VIEGKAYVLWVDFYKRQHMHEYWDFGKAADWFFNDLVPKVFEWDRINEERKRKLERSLKSQLKQLVGWKSDVSSRGGAYGFDLEEFLKDLRKPEFFINQNQEIETQEYIRLVQRLQYFYDVLGNWQKIYLSAKQLKEFFEAMLIILKKDGVQTHPNYLAGNIGFINRRFEESEINELIIEIEKAIRENRIKDDYGICFAIRNIKNASEECVNPFTEEEINKVLEKLKPLIDFYNRSNIIDKFDMHLKDRIRDGN